MFSPIVTDIYRGLHILQWFMLGEMHFISTLNTYGCDFAIIISLYLLIRPSRCINLRLQPRNARYCVCSLRNPLEFIYLCIQPHNPYEVLFDIYPSI